MSAAAFTVQLHEDAPSCPQKNELLWQQRQAGDELLGRQDASRAPLVRLRAPSQPLLLLLLIVGHMCATETHALIDIPPPELEPRWFYNGTHASSSCEATFRCDTSEQAGLSPACSCHPNCSLFDACCEDVRPGDWRHLALPRSAYECAVYPRLTTDGRGAILINTAAFVFLITECPSTHRVLRAVAKLCVEQRNVSSTNGSRLLPWVTDSVTGVTFSNQFCALCHGVEAKRMIFWNASYICIKDYYLKPLGLSGCRYYMLTDYSVTKSTPACLGTYLETCPNGSPQQDACTSNPAKYLYDHSNFVTYRNYNCTLCHSQGAYKPECTPYSIETSMPFTPDLLGVLGIDACPKKLLTFATQEDLEAFMQLCPSTVIDTESCSETVDNTTLMALFSGGDGTWEYRVTPNGVRLQINGTHSVCYRCQPVTVYNYTLQSESVLLLATREAYNKPLFQVEVNGSVTICSEPKPIELPPGACSDLPSEVSVVLMSLSLLGLAMYAVAYFALPPLRNLPGQIVLHQSVAFIAAFVFWLLRTPARHSNEACVALGILTHLFFVAAFTWTTIYAVEVVRALGIQAYVGDHAKRLRWYAIVGWLVPAHIMAIAIAVNWAPTDYFDPSYRPAYGAPQCFINNPVPQRIFFTAPLAAFLFIDVVIYAYIIVRLAVISAQTKMVRENHHEKLVLALKLVFALGITWIFAVLAAVTGNCYLAYIFTLLNSLQGVFLFLIFVCNAKTSRKIRQKMRNRKTLTSDATTRATVSSQEQSHSTTFTISQRQPVL